MPIATISDTTLAEVNALPREHRLEARPYRLPRPAGAFLAVELALLAIVLLEAARGGNTLGVAILLASCGIFFHLNDVDKFIVSSKFQTFSIDVLESIGFGFLAAVLLFYLFPGLAPSQGVALAGALLVSLLPVVLRSFLGYLVNHQILVEGVLIVGTGYMASKLYRALAAGRGHLKSAEDHADGLLNFPESPTDQGVTVDYARLNEMVARDRISHVIVAERDAQSREKLAAALMAPRLRGLAVSDAVDFYEQFSGKLWVEALNPEWFVYTDGFKHSKAGNGLKRLFDVTFALLLILPAAPLLAIIAIAIKLDSPGPVLYRQVRVGLDGEPFVIYKFRSMRHDAELETGPVWTGEQDERITKVGRLLRKFRLDEIPQAINVVRGEMSLVGPRPERPYFVDRLKIQIPFYDLRHYAKPGVTGWAQVMYSYGSSVEDAREKLQYDLYYVKHKSVRFDVWILLKTIQIVLFGRGR
jgi:sugar transferase (PEP-CTERM system associated)